jgi:hypothetical protein
MALLKKIIGPDGTPNPGLTPEYFDEYLANEYSDQNVLKKFVIGVFSKYFNDSEGYLGKITQMRTNPNTYSFTYAFEIPDDPNFENFTVDSSNIENEGNQEKIKTSHVCT